MKRFELEGSQAKILHTDQSYIYISALKENTESSVLKSSTLHVINRSDLQRQASMGESGQIICCNTLDQTDSPGYLFVSVKKNQYSRNNVIIYQRGGSFNKIKNIQMMTITVLQIHTFAVPKEQDIGSGSSALVAVFGSIKGKSAHIRLSYRVAGGGNTKKASS